jgi:hypothetical protein
MFVVTNVLFLGHVVGKTKTNLNLEKIKVIKKFPIPKVIMNVKAFLGLTSYHRNYVKAYACIVVPLFELTKCDVYFQWNLDCQKYFEQLKNPLVSTLVLVNPISTKLSFLE